MTRMIPLISNSFVPSYLIRGTPKGASQQRKAQWLQCACSASWDANLVKKKQEVPGKKYTETALYGWIGKALSTSLQG
jgi:hypothetical protein